MCRECETLRRTASEEAGRKNSRRSSNRKDTAAGASIATACGEGDDGTHEEVDDDDSAFA